VIAPNPGRITLRCARELPHDPMGAVIARCERPFLGAHPAQITLALALNVCLLIKPFLGGELEFVE
jgi:hypothetical protein